MGDRAVKCVVWDLDDTVWDGVLVEGGGGALRAGVADALETLDQRGILQSVASRNDPGLALERLAEFGVARYFLHPQISWGAKSAAVAVIAECLGIGIDTLLLVDDSPFERAEVAAAYPQVRTCDGADIAALLARPDLSPAVVTDDARRRRSMYVTEERRREHQERHGISGTEFVRSLGLRLWMSYAGADDLDRVHELVTRTNQLNTTGLVFSREELARLSAADDHAVLVVALEDRFGTYGSVGVVVVAEDRAAATSTIRLFLLSCRVLGRNVGTSVLTYLVHRARDRGHALFADFRRTRVNEAVYRMYRLNGFAPWSTDGDVETLVYRGGDRAYPDFVDVTEPDGHAAARGG